MTDTAKHTPGRWVVEDNAIMAVVGAHICTVSTSDDFPCITENDDQTEEEARASCDAESEANARLIAAAPELLEALKAIVAANNDFISQMPRDWEGDPMQDACASAALVIDKAEGRS